MLNPDLDVVPLNSDEIARYSRHLILPEVGMAGQKRLKAARVLCIGTGGLGSPLLLYLAAAGVGHLGIVDFDVVDRSNLQRQVIHSSAWLDRSKVESARDRILAINPHCQVDVHETQITAANAFSLIEPYDIVVDGTDNFPTRYLVNDACVLLNKPNVYGSIYRFDGQATVFNYKGGWRRPAGWETLSQDDRTQARHRQKDWIYDPDAPGPNYRDLYPAPPPPGLVPSCAEGGVLGVLPGMIGMIQATETLKIILANGGSHRSRSLSGRLLVYNALDLSFRELKLQPNPDRPIIDRLIDYDQFCGIPSNKEPQSPMQTISVTDLKAKLDSGAQDFVLLDVRNPHEVEIAKIPGAVLVPLAEIENGEGIAKIQALAADKTLIVHCKAGGRSAKAIEILSTHGITGINVTGGITAWSREVDPSVPEY
jgi:sulfur-carrier protein adenylyltransferase/sulfurtransferase